MREWIQFEKRLIFLFLNFIMICANEFLWWDHIHIDNSSMDSATKFIKLLDQFNLQA